MRDTVRPATEADVRELGDRWGLDVGQSEDADLDVDINDRLEGTV